MDKPTNQPTGTDAPADDQLFSTPAAASRTASDNATEPQAVDGLAAPTLRLPGFLVRGVIARGGMGVVYRARQTSLAREVALKVLAPALAGDPIKLERFRGEARIAARLTEHGILPVYDVLEYDGTPVLVLPFIEGSDLAKIIAARRAVRDGQRCDGGHPWSRLADDAYREAVLPVLDKLLDALASLHQARVLHRDIKPSNLLVDLQGNGWLSDFGLARLGDGGGLTVEGSCLGTPGYMSPEQWDGVADLDARADVFSAGVTLYHALTLEMPYGRERLSARMAPPSRRSDRQQPPLPPGLEVVLSKAICPDRAGRYTSVAEMRQDWLDARKGRPTQAGRRRVLPRLPGGPLPAVIAACLLIGLFVGAKAWIFPGRGEGSDEPVVAPGPVEDQSRAVRLITEPAEARVVLVPLDEWGYPRPERAVRPEGAQVTPLVLPHVPPGTYLVVATKAGHGFHEVYRTVPGRNSAGPGAFRHTHWKEKEGAVEFLPIQIPATDPAPVDMTRFAGGEFTLGNNKDFSGPAERRLVADFWLDCTEVTVDAYRDKAKLSPDAEGLPGDSAVTFVTFDDAVQYAERIGKRLPTEAEYEYAATGRGRRDFPWEDGLRRIPAWPLGAVRASPFDHTPTDPPVFGLYSNVVEWTSSPAVRYPDNPQLVQAQAPFRNQRVIRGGPYSVLVGHPDLNDRLINAGPRMRNTADSNSRHAGLGFRCAQSVAPPYLEAAPVSADH